MASNRLSSTFLQTPKNYRERMNHGTAATSRKTFRGRHEKVFEHPEVHLFLLSTDPPGPIIGRKGIFLMHVTANVEPNEGKPIFFTSCAVDDYFWPVAKDMVVLRTGFLSFAFVLPYILYGIQFPFTCTQDTIKSVETFFQWNSQFIDLSQPNGYQFQEDDPYFWTNVVPVIDDLSCPMIIEMGHHFQGTIDHKKINHFSVVTKLICEALYVGLLSNHGIEYLDGRPTSEGSKKGSKQPTGDTFPSVTCVTNVAGSFGNDPWKFLRMCTTSSSRSALWSSWMTEKLCKIDCQKLGVRLWRLNKQTMYECFAYLAIEQYTQDGPFLPGWNCSLSNQNVEDK